MKVLVSICPHFEPVGRLDPARPGTPTKCVQESRHAIFRPEFSNRQKSDVFVVAMGAPSVSATAAIMQSINDPRRLPESLNIWAATAAWSDVKSRRGSMIASANSTSRRESGPHRNSPQATVLIVSDSPFPIQSRNLRSSGVPNFSARIRKLVSKWIIRASKRAVEQPRAARPSGPAPTDRHRPCARARRPAIGRERRGPHRLPIFLPLPQSEWRAATLQSSILSSVSPVSPACARIRRPASTSI